MKISILLLLISFNVMNFKARKGSFSIQFFINTLKEQGIFDLLTDIKYYFGSDVAIETCLQIYPTNDCEIVVNKYIEDKGRYKQAGVSSVSNNTPSTSVTRGGGGETTTKEKKFDSGIKRKTQTRINKNSKKENSRKLKELINASRIPANIKKSIGDKIKKRFKNKFS